MFSFGERVGLLFTVQAATVTAACNTSILVFVVYKRFKRARRGNILTTDATDSSLFINLMIADLVQAMGNILNVQWIKEAVNYQVFLRSKHWLILSRQEITEGSLCRAQAVLKQLGSDSVALTCLAITLQTFFTLILRWNIRRTASKLTILGIWAFTGLVIGIPYAATRTQRYYGPTGYWCWILSTHKTAQLMSQYLYMWSTAILMVILYGIMFLIMHNGMIDEEVDKESKKVARRLLFYPVVYVVCVAPLSVTRWMGFQGDNVSYQVLLFSSTLYALTGFFNLILFSITRPALLSDPSTVKMDATPLSPIPNSHRYHPGQESRRPVYPGNYGYLPDASVTGSDMDQGQLMDGGPEGLGNSTTSNPIGASGGLVPRMESGNLENERVHHTHNVQNYHTQFSSSFAGGDREGPATGTWNGRDSNLDYTSAVDETDDYGRLPG
ncbi:uncharacterized protein LACBIDRAFT_298950 [Laccaria bicolor S238N-H82]|uniref:Predicted protein n=1 Tax=Laccaria bicolor (strain S238N-H82 / ATCC MYA-4686) TaxID=486041 RepID=B0DDN9_LACBS|nr:uncharacterized protein LACBIDRAFT_298950 [Laccaria bicolor S238N-H82]EDR07123.1 predicted protein [Laccaria bicolor S238N-H82]|eukprot:XP_001882054.1 predicted protein [Laccaria bicolor S238N-H82]